MHYLTNYYKNLSEQLQRQINTLESQLNEVVITKVVNGKTVSWDPSKMSERDAEVEAGVRSEADRNRDDIAYRRELSRGGAERRADGPYYAGDDPEMRRSWKAREQGFKFNLDGSIGDQDIDIEDRKREREATEVAKLKAQGRDTSQGPSRGRKL